MFEENLFENVLKSFRVRRGKEWTQESIAVELGVSRRTYINWENGKSLPSPGNLKNIVAVFKLNEADATSLYAAAAQVSPATHNLPFPPNPFFTGHEMDLKQLGQMLKESGDIVPTQPISISGLGGIGKTQLALEYAHRCYREKVYRAVFWIDATDKAAIEASYLSLAQSLGLPEQHGHETARIVQAAKQWLEVHKNWLMIIDNADTLQLARASMPIAHEGHILLTTRSLIGTTARQIEIEAMEPAEGLLFLLKRASLAQDEDGIAVLADDVREAASKLVRLLGGHPLALDQAGAYLKETRVSVVDYVQLYQQERQTLLSRRGLAATGGDHPENVAATVALTFRKACEQQPLAEDVMYFCSFLRPNAIPEGVLLQAEGLKLDALSFNEVVAALQHYSLIKRNTQDKTLSIHRLVQAVLVDSMPSDLREQWSPCVIHTLCNPWLRDSYPYVHSVQQTICPRLVASLDKSVDEDDAFFLLFGIDITVKVQETSLGKLELVLPASWEPLEVNRQRCLSIAEKYLGAEHPRTVKLLIHLAGLCMVQGKYEQAETLYERALAAIERHVETMGTAVSLTRPMEPSFHQGGHERAEILHERILSIMKQGSGITDPYVEYIRKHYTVFLFSIGRTADSEAIESASIKELLSSLWLPSFVFDAYDVSFSGCSTCLVD